jgi:hypothetical protein
MTLVGCDLHARRQQVAVLDTATGEVREEQLAHDGDAGERFYATLSPPLRWQSRARGTLSDSMR